MGAFGEDEPAVRRRREAEEQRRRNDGRRRAAVQRDVHQHGLQVVLEQRRVRFVLQHVLVRRCRRLAAVAFLNGRALRQALSARRRGASGRYDRRQQRMAVWHPFEGTAQRLIDDVLPMRCALAPATSPPTAPPLPAWRR